MMIQSAYRTATKAVAKQRSLGGVSSSETRRSFAVYATGTGWTGALGTGSLDDHFVGHDDEEEATDPPHLLYSGDVASVAVGWGHTAIITKEKELLLCGRPHDFQALLRIKRLPGFIRKPALEYALNYNVDENERNSPSFVGQIFAFLVGPEGEDGPWDDARRNSILRSLHPLAFPDGDQAMAATTRTNNNNGDGQFLDASAGLTAVIGEKSGHLYTFGINHQGQCGVGASSNNVWTPTKVMGLSTEFADEGHEKKLEQQHPIVSVSLGLQHGLALDAEGHMYTWGKGERGQLGQGTKTVVRSDHAIRIRDFRIPSDDGRRKLIKDPKVTKIAAGMNHSAALTDDNLVFVWGKNVARPSKYNQEEDKGKIVVDSPFPSVIMGLPEGLAVLDLACGSHHTAMLMEDGSVFAIGVTTDQKEPLFEAIEIVPPGVIDMPCRQFAAHFDRTTIVGKDGTQVLQIHLWSDEEFRENALFSPPWIEYLINDNKRIRSLHRGWLHSVVVTDE